MMPRSLAPGKDRIETVRKDLRAVTDAAKAILSHHFPELSLHSIRTIRMVEKRTGDFGEFYAFMTPRKVFVLTMRRAIVGI